VADGAPSHEQRRVCAQGELPSARGRAGIGRRKKAGERKDMGGERDAQPDRVDEKLRHVILEVRDVLSMGVRERGAAAHANMSCAALAGGPVLGARADGGPRRRALWL
jgi:hypothetical protein